MDSVVRMAHFGELDSSSSFGTCTGTFLLVVLVTQKFSMPSRMSSVTSSIFYTVFLLQSFFPSFISWRPDGLLVWLIAPLAPLPLFQKELYFLSSKESAANFEDIYLEKYLFNYP